jgi:hypothetical protein
MSKHVIAAVLLMAGGGSVFAQRAPAPIPVNLPPEVISLACAPSLTFEDPPVPVRVIGGQDADIRRTFAPGDLVTINAGADNGIDVGQEYYTRRAVTVEKRSIGRDNPATIRTSGWIRIYAVDRKMSLATIVHACDAVEVDDYVEPFAPPSVPLASDNRPDAQRGNYGRVIVGNDNRTAFGRGDYFIVDRGSDHGVTVGDGFVVYRDHQRRERMLLEHTGESQNSDRRRNFLFELGEAVAVEVRPDRSTLLVTLSRDAFIVGDWVALRK